MSYDPCQGRLRRVYTKLATRGRKQQFFECQKLFPLTSEGTSPLAVYFLRYHTHKVLKSPRQ